MPLSPDPNPAFCTEMQRLVAVFAQAVSDYLRVQSAQSQALIDGHGFKFDAEITQARKQKDAARAAILAHQREHGC